MKTDPSPVTIASPARRSFLRSLAVMGGATVLAPLSGKAHASPACSRPISNWLAKRMCFEATGVTTFHYITPFLWPTQGLPPKAELEAGGAYVWVSYKFPCQGRDLMSVVVKQPLPDNPQVLVPISDFMVDVEEVTFGPPVGGEQPGLPPVTLPPWVPDDVPEPTGAMPTFSLLGRIVKRDADLPLPFGEIVGRTMTLSAAFTREGRQTHFYLLGGAAAGSHTTWVRKATGSLRLHGLGY